MSNDKVTRRGVLHSLLVLSVALVAPFGWLWNRKAKAIIATAPELTFAEMKASRHFRGYRLHEHSSDALKIAWENGAAPSVSGIDCSVPDDAVLVVVWSDASKAEGKPHGTRVELYSPAFPEVPTTAYYGDIPGAGLVRINDGRWRDTYDYGPAHVAIIKTKALAVNDREPQFYNKHVDADGNPRLCAQCRIPLDDGGSCYGPGSHFPNAPKEAYTRGGCVIVCHACVAVAMEANP